MNKKTVSKVNLFFGGLVSRMEENKDFFNDITINLKELRISLQKYCIRTI